MAFQVIYSSQAVAPLSMAELEAILVDAREGNRRRGVTGALVYVDGVFLQILEGPRDVVQRLMASIARDTRHGSIHVFHEAETERPAFGSWKMAYLESSPGQVAAWLGLEGTATVDELMADLHRTPSAATRVVDGILRAVAG
jgi:hypothetical protein